MRIPVASRMLLLLSWLLFVNVKVTEALTTTPISPGIYVEEGHSLVVTVAKGKPTIAFYHLTLLSLFVIRCGDFTCATVESLASVDNSTADIGSELSIAIREGDELPVLAYHDRTQTCLKVMECLNDACTSSNTTLFANNVGEVAGKYTSIDLEKGTNFPIISHQKADTGSLKIFRCTKQDCSSFSNKAPITQNTTWMSLKLRSNNLPSISYKDEATASLKLLLCATIDCSGTQNTILTLAAGAGEYNSLVLDSEDRPIISYFDRINGYLRLIRCNDLLCTTKSDTIVDNTAGTVYLWTTIALKMDGNPIIGYKRSAGNEFWMASCKEPTCATMTLLFKAADGGNSASIAVLPGSNSFVGVGGQQANLKLVTNTYDIVCPPNSVFSQTYDPTTGYAICTCDMGYVSTSTAGVRLAIPYLFQTCIPVTFTCPLNSALAYENGGTGVPICLCNQGYVDSLAVKQPVDPTGTCSEYACPTNSILTYDTTDGSPICTCNTNYIDTTTGLQTVGQDGTCTLSCPPQSQKVDGEETCLCDKGYTGDVVNSPISPREATPVTGECTLKCGYKGAECTTNNDCCKPNTKFVCRQSQCVVCRKLGTICTQNKQCCSGRCNRKASVCRAPLE